MAIRAHGSLHSLGVGTAVGVATGAVDMHRVERHVPAGKRVLRRQRQGSGRVRTGRAQDATARWQRVHPTQCTRHPTREPSRACRSAAVQIQLCKVDNKAPPPARRLTQTPCEETASECNECKECNEQPWHTRGAPATHRSSTSTHTVPRATAAQWRAWWVRRGVAREAARARAVLVARHCVGGAAH